ncbi:MAG TPA: DUF1456 family protein [Flavobacterium sp.]|nr:DUF1456 family protein [Flavobacterium sp.]
MTNNDIFKKLRVALQLRDDQIVEILSLVDFRISKGEIGNFFRSEDHPKYVECQDQVLRNFLNGLVIHLRGTKENPKDPKEVLQKIKETKSTEKIVKPKPIVKPTTMRQKSKPTKKDIMGNVKFNNGKQKKKD